MYNQRQREINWVKNTRPLLYEPHGGAFPKLTACVTSNKSMKKYGKLYQIWSMRRYWVNGVRALLRQWARQARVAKARSMQLHRTLIYALRTTVWNWWYFTHVEGPHSHEFTETASTGTSKDLTNKNQNSNVCNTHDYVRWVTKSTMSTLFGQCDTICPVLNTQSGYISHALRRCKLYELRILWPVLISE